MRPALAIAEPEPRCTAGVAVWISLPTRPSLPCPHRHYRGFGRELKDVRRSRRLTEVRIVFDADTCGLRGTSTLFS
ncbi:hypothetical protein OUZ56_002711 [Daphnia magna]|uniref:Uncharacterized protein n=1 Tax=Daphnia magna TaxID=35525 RepID=A0ABR0A6M6_9CRUS|nr:hypothetical protein OUZ56_002711 [Daphnia magna]